jgi:hypothetical protein
MEYHCPSFWSSIPTTFDAFPDNRLGLKFIHAYYKYSLILCPKSSINKSIADGEPKGYTIFPPTNSPVAFPILFT